MRYMMLIYGSEAEGANITPEQWQTVMEAHNAFSGEAQKRGILLGGEALHPTHMAKTLRSRGSEWVVTDGPFAETKEQLGGYYAFKTDDVNEILELAKMLPLGENDSIEVRPIMEFE